MNYDLDFLRPFVRYAQITKINDTRPFRGMMAYDFRLFYVLSGNGKIKVNGTEYRAVRGSLFVWRPGAEYSLINESGGYLELIGLNFDLDFSNSEKKTPIFPVRVELFKKEEALVPYFFNKDALFFDVIYQPFATNFESELLSMVNDYKNKLRYFDHKLSGRLLSLLSDLVGLHEQGAVLRNDNERIEKILSVIKENYSGFLTNEMIGETLGYHKNHVNRLMVSYTGTSLHKYLQNYRLERAIELLETTALSVSEIALQVGFDDISHFSKYFKKRFGYSPSEFRKYSDK